MKRSTLRGLALIPLALVWLLAGCSSPSPMSRIDANRALFDSWPQDMQSAVFEGRVINGMTPEMVRMSLGEPTRKEPRVGSATNEETWTYVKSDGSSGTSAVRPNISIGGLGGLGVSTGRRGGGGRGGGGGSNAKSTTEETEIVFQNSVVTRVG